MTATISSLPRRWVWFVVAYVLAWTLLPALLAPSLPLDVVEGIAWGHEWQWGHYKHPPLPGWLLYPSYRLLGKFGPFLLGQLSILVALFYVWRLARDLLGEPHAWLAAALLYGVFYYTWPAHEFNHNIIQIPIWAALGWHFHVALTRRGNMPWVWLGVWAGVSLFAKYSSALFLASMGLWLLLGPQRRCLRQPGPWLALAVAVLVISPHLAWLVRHGGLPFVYLADRSRAAVVQHGALKSLGFIGAQLIAHLPLFAILGACRLWPRGWRLQLAMPGRESWLWSMAFGPALLTALIGLLAGGGLRDMWGTPMWNFTPLVLLALVPAPLVAARVRGLVRGLVIWMSLITLATVVWTGWGASWSGRPSRIDWPAAALADQAAQQWQTLSTCPLQVVAGNYWDAGLIAEGIHPMASILIAGDARFSPWVSPQRLKTQGALLVWRADNDALPIEAPPLTTMAASNWHVSQGQWQVAWPRNKNGQPLRMHWRAYVPDRCAR